MILSLILALATSVLVVCFVAYNRSLTEILLFAWSEEGTVDVIKVIAVGLGILIGILVLLPVLLGRTWMLLRYRRQLENLRHAANAQVRGGGSPE
jgi:hypothetical protein